MNKEESQAVAAMAAVCAEMTSLSWSTHEQMDIARKASAALRGWLDLRVKGTCVDPVADRLYGPGVRSEGDLYTVAQMMADTLKVAAEPIHKNSTPGTLRTWPTIPGGDK